MPAEVMQRCRRQSRHATLTASLRGISHLRGQSLFTIRRQGFSALWDQKLSARKAICMAAKLRVIDAKQVAQPMEA
jgi:hypothetical protein